jgi:hypothetical protein
MSPACACPHLLQPSCIIERCMLRALLCSPCVLVIRQHAPMVCNHQRLGSQYFSTTVSVSAAMCVRATLLSGLSLTVPYASASSLTLLLASAMMKGCLFHGYSKNAAAFPPPAPPTFLALSRSCRYLQHDRVLSCALCECSCRRASPSHAQRLCRTFMSAVPL